MENTLNFDNTFVAGSKAILNIINKLKEKLKIPEATGFFTKIMMWFAPSRIGIYTLIGVMMIVFAITAPLYAGPNYLIHKFNQAKIWVMKRFSSKSSALVKL